MGLNRNIDDLTPEMAGLCREFLRRCVDDPVFQKHNVTIRLNETRRTTDIQRAYFAQGREDLDTVNSLREIAGLWKINQEANSRAITWTMKSKHILGEAFDACPVLAGDFWWKAPQEVWSRMGQIGKDIGLKWGGDWKNQDSPHFEF